MNNQKNQVTFTVYGAKSHSKTTQIEKSELYWPAEKTNYSKTYYIAIGQHKNMLIYCLGLHVINQKVKSKYAFECSIVKVLIQSKTQVTLNVMTSVVTMLTK